MSAAEGDTDPRDSDPARRWVRRSGVWMRDTFNGEVTPPEEIWPLLDFLQVELYPDGLSHALRLRLRAGRFFCSGYVDYNCVDDPEVWRCTLAKMVESRRQELHPEEGPR